MYNPEAVRIWPSKAEEEEALRIEAEEADRLAIETEERSDTADGTAFNATTGSYSGLYGQQPIDADTQATLDAIMNISSHQNTVDYLLSGGQPATGAAYGFGEKKNNDAAEDDIIIPDDQDEVLREANEIYERLMREAAEDAAKKQAEIDAARSVYEQNLS